MAGDLTAEELQELIAETGLELDPEQVRMLLAYLRATESMDDPLAALEHLRATSQGANSAAA